MRQDLVHCSGPNLEIYQALPQPLSETKERANSCLVNAADRDVPIPSSSIPVPGVFAHWIHKSTWQFQLQAQSSMLPEAKKTNVRQNRSRASFNPARICPSDRSKSRPDILWTSTIEIYCSLSFLKIFRFCRFCRPSTSLHFLGFRGLGAPAEAEVPRADLAAGRRAARRAPVPPWMAALAGSRRGARIHGIHGRRGLGQWGIGLWSIDGGGGVQMVGPGLGKDSGVLGSDWRLDRLGKLKCKWTEVFKVKK